MYLQLTNVECKRRLCVEREYCGHDGRTGFCDDLASRRNSLLHKAYNIATTMTNVPHKYALDAEISYTRIDTKHNITFCQITKFPIQKNNRERTIFPRQWSDSQQAQHNNKQNNFLSINKTTSEFGNGVLCCVVLCFVSFSFGRVRWCGCEANATTKNGAKAKATFKITSLAGDGMERMELESDVEKKNRCTRRKKKKAHYTLAAIYA